MPLELIWYGFTVLLFGCLLVSFLVSMLDYSGTCLFAILPFVETDSAAFAWLWFAAFELVAESGCFWTKTGWCF